MGTLARPLFGIPNEEKVTGNPPQADHPPTDKRIALMALDVYAACPCGSNKKLKFCCHGLEGSIEQVVRHQSAKQYKQALQLLDTLERRYPLILANPDECRLAKISVLLPKTGGRQSEYEPVAFGRALC